MGRAVSPGRLLLTMGVRSSISRCGKQPKMAMFIRGFCHFASARSCHGIPGFLRERDFPQVLLRTGGPLCSNRESRSMENQPENERDELRDPLADERKIECGFRNSHLSVSETAQAHHRPTNRVHHESRRHMAEGRHVVAVAWRTPLDAWLPKLCGEPARGRQRAGWSEPAHSWARSRAYNVLHSIQFAFHETIRLSLFVKLRNKHS